MNVTEVNIEDLEMKHERLRVRDSRGEKNLLLSLSEAGQQSPIVVVKDGKRYVVIDGHKRVRALKKLKSDVVQVTVWAMPAADALALNYRMNPPGMRHAFEEGWLIEELHHHWTLEEIGKKLLRSKSWVSRRLSLVEDLPEWLTDDVIAGRMGAHAAVTHVMPLMRINTGEVRGLLEKIRSAGLTDRQIKEITNGYRTARAEVRRKIAEDPLLFLKARVAATTDSGLSDVEGRCVKNLTIIGNISLGLAKSLPEALPTEADGTARSTIRQAWSICEERWRWLEKTAAAVFRAG